MAASERFALEWPRYMTFDTRALIARSTTEGGVDARRNETRRRGTEARSMLLIGPGKHFGAELIERFLVEGFDVGVISSTAGGSSGVQDRFHHDARVHFSVGDASDEGALGAAVARLASIIGPFECAIYNPKISVSSSGLNTSAGDLRRSLEVNVTGALISIKALVPYMAVGCFPSIILTGGGYKDIPEVEKFALSVGKAALHGVARAMKEPLGRVGILLKTIIIDGAVRRSNKSLSPNELADFYWSVFSRSGGSVFRFSTRSSEASAEQLSLPV